MCKLLLITVAFLLFQYAGVAQVTDKEVSDQISSSEGNKLVADAGADIVTTMPLNKIILDGSNTRKDNKGFFIKSYKWKKISGPSEGDIIFPTKEKTRVKNLVVGTYVFKFTVTINTNETASDLVKVIVKPDPVKPGDVPFNANTKVPYYNALFQYGTNPSSYGNGWSDTKIADIAVKAGAHSLRLPLPDFFVAHYDYDIRLDAFNYYTHDLDMKEITLFVGKPRDEHRDHTVFPPSTRQSAVFANLYTPIWDHGENGTPINDENYFALYVYNLEKRYGKDVKFWEIVNEADATGFWDNGRRDRPDSWYNEAPSSKSLLNLRAPVYYYIRMLRVAYEVIKKFAPNDYVTTGGIGYPAFLDALLRYTDNPDGGKVTSEYPLKGGAYFDVLSFHSYPAYNFQIWDNSIGGFRYLRYSDRAVNAVIDLKKEFEDVLEQYGYDGIKYPKKLFTITETNLTRKIFGTYYGGKEIQRNFIIKMLTKAQQNDIKQFYIYQIGETANYNTAKGAYDLMGLYENLKKDKPGQEKLTDEGIAFKTTSMLLYGWRYDETRTKQLNLPQTVDGMAFKKDGKYRYVLWAKTHIDKSEAANATYSFPASFDLAAIDRYEWNYAVDKKAISRINTQNIPLTGTPVFFSETEKAANELPIAKAGKDQTIVLPSNSVILNGSASSDPDGTIVKYEWSKTAGPSSFAFDKQDNVQTKITGLTSGTYTFTLTITDNKGATTSDEVQVTVNKVSNSVPTAKAGNDLSVTLPKNSVTLDGSASKDEDGKITSYKWSKTSGPDKFHIENDNAVSTKVTGLTEGTYVFSLTVKDNKGASSFSKVTIKVKPAEVRPIANAGKDQTIILPANSVVLDGSASTGIINDWYWSKQSGPGGYHLYQNNGPKAKVTDLKPGIYVFSLTVSGKVGWPSSSSVTIIVKNPDAQNKRPVALAGKDQTITLPQNSVILNGSGSIGEIDDWYWSMQSGPGSAFIHNANRAQTKVTDLVPGTYVFSLTVSGQVGWPSSSSVTVTVEKNDSYSRLAQGSNVAESTYSKGASSDSVLNTSLDEKAIAVNNPNKLGSGKDSLKLLTFKVYPNPVHDQLYIEFSRKNRGHTIFRIVDVKGRILKIFNLGDQKNFHKVIDVSSLVNGMYFIQLIKDDQLRSVQKILKF